MSSSLEMTDAERTRYEALCDRVLAHCRQQGWFGAEDGPVTEPYPDESLWEPKIKTFMTNGRTVQYTSWRTIPPDHNVLIIRAQRDVTYPPATEEQLEATEAHLGGPIPPLLRLLYQRVANGGRCIAGLHGAVGGCPMQYEYAQPIWWYRGQPVEIPQRPIEDIVPWTKGAKPLPAHVVEALKRYRGTFITYEYEKGFPCTPFLWLTEPRECGLMLDGETGHLYWDDIGSGRVGTDGEEEFPFGVLRFVADSLEEYIERWLDGTSSLSKGHYVGEIRSTAADWAELSFENVKPIRDADE